MLGVKRRSVILSGFRCISTYTSRYEKDALWRWFIFLNDLELAEVGSHAIVYLLLGIQSRQSANPCEPDKISANNPPLPTPL